MLSLPYCGTNHSASLPLSTKSWDSRHSRNDGLRSLGIFLGKALALVVNLYNDSAV